MVPKAPSLEVVLDYWWRMYFESILTYMSTAMKKLIKRLKSRGGSLGVSAEEEE